MWASPDCTSHSKAKGGAPIKSGLRILPWAVHKHAVNIKPDVIIMENVEEIRQWGPLNKKGRPIKKKKCKEYQKFMKKMYLAGYEKIQTRELVAADYGAPTTRKRWYAILRRDGKPIIWPEPTHSKTGSDGKQRWKQCGDFIDWSDLGKSIFDRPKPLADATMKRIANGYVKYVVNNTEPYMVKSKDAVSFLIQYHGETKLGGSRGQLLAEPIKTIDTSNRYGLVTAFITKFYKTGIGQGCDEPLHTITTSPRNGCQTGKCGHLPPAPSTVSARRRGKAPPRDSPPEDLHGHQSVRYTDQDISSLLHARFPESPDAPRRS